MTVVAVVVVFLFLFYSFFIFTFTFVFILSDLPFWLIEISLEARTLAQVSIFCISVLNTFIICFVRTHLHCCYCCCSVSLARDELKPLFSFFYVFFSFTGRRTSRALFRLLSTTSVLLRSRNEPEEKRIRRKRARDRERETEERKRKRERKRERERNPECHPKKESLNIRERKEGSTITVYVKEEVSQYTETVQIHSLVDRYSKFE